MAALLLFIIIYTLIKSLFKINFEKLLPAPGAWTVLLFAIILGIVSFLVRIIFPVGWVLKPLGFQLGHFPQYIVLFGIGLMAFRNNWFEGLTEQTGKRLTLSAWLCLLFFPVFFLIQKKLNIPVEWYSGGLHWQSLLYAIWEQWIGLSILTALLIKGKRSWNTSSPLLSKLSRSSFAVYIFHPLVVVSLSMMVRNWMIDPAIKLLIVAPIAVLASFSLGSLILLIPGDKKII